MFAARWASLTSANAFAATRSRRKSWTIAIPEMCSWRNAFTRAILTRTSRYVSRAPLRNQFVTQSIGTRIPNVMAASAGFSTKRMTTIPVRTTTSPSSATKPDVKSSFRASTSVVRRVMRRPTGVRSKTATSACWRCPKIHVLRSNMTPWPIVDVHQTMTIMRTNARSAIATERAAIHSMP